MTDDQRIAQEIYNRLTNNGTDEFGKDLYNNIAAMAGLPLQYASLVTTMNDTVQQIANGMTYSKETAGRINSATQNLLQLTNNSQPLLQALIALRNE